MDVYVVCILVNYNGLKPISGPLYCVRCLSWFVVCPQKIKAREFHDDQHSRSGSRLSSLRIDLMYLLDWHYNLLFVYYRSVFSAPRLAAPWLVSSSSSSENSSMNPSPFLNLNPWINLRFLSNPESIFPRYRPISGLLSQFWKLRRSLHWYRVTSWINIWTSGWQFRDHKLQYVCCNYKLGVGLFLGERCHVREAISDGICISVEQSCRPDIWACYWVS